MARYTVMNTSGSTIVLPISPSVNLRKGQSKTINVAASTMEHPDIIKYLRAGALNISSVDDPDTPDSVEVSPRSVSGGGSGSSVLTSTAHLSTISEPTVGSRVRISSLPYIYEYQASGSWEIVDAVGNLSIVSEINNGSTGAVRYVNTDIGNDENDGLTPSTAWKSGVRAFDEVPDVEAIGRDASGGFAFYEIRVTGSTALDLPATVNFQNTSNFNITVIPDLTSATPAEVFDPLPAGTRPVLPGAASATKAAVFEHAVGAFSTVLSDGSHWAAIKTTVGGIDFWDPHTIDGDGSDNVAGTLRILGASDISAGGTADLEIHPISQELAVNAPNNGFFMFNENLNTASVRVNGFKNSASVSAFSPKYIELTGSYVTSSAFFSMRGGFGTFSPGSGPVVEGSFVAFAAQIGDNLGGNPGVVGGIFRKGLFLTDAKRIIMSNAIFRGAPQGFLGSFHVVFGRRGASVSGEVDRVDFESNGSGDGFRARYGSILELANTAQGLTFESVRRAFVIEERSLLTLVAPRLFGDITVASEVREAAYSEGLAALDGTTDALDNTSVSGNDIVVGADPTIRSWADLPLNDIAVGGGAEIVRVG